MSARQLLTVDDFKSWQRVNAAVQAEIDERARADLVDALLRQVGSHMNLGLQTACNHAWRCIGRHVPHAHKALAVETLEAVGWVREREEPAE